MNMLIWTIALMIISTILYKNFQLSKRLAYHVEEHACMSRKILNLKETVEEQKQLIEQLKKRIR